MNTLFSFLLLLCLGTSALFSQQIEVSNITIARDSFGVPHIQAKTDVEVGYGLAWAQAEDDFKTVQELILLTQGRLAEVRGKDGAVLDFLAFILELEEGFEQEYDSVFSPKYRAIVEAFAMGLNRYAATHPKEVLRKGVFPVSGADVMKGSAFTMFLMNQVHLEVEKIFKGILDLNALPVYTGSNAFAFSPQKTTDGHTYLAINSHQPLEGLFSWYEAHLISEEGMNVHGATFPGGIHLYVGATETTGWAFTVNHPDLCDTYQLEMHPERKNVYKFDGEWLELRERSLKVKVKVLGGLRIPVKKTFYHSVYGPTIKTKQGYFSLRFPAATEMRNNEYTWGLNRMEDFDDFMTIIRDQPWAGLNLVYADRDGNIFMISNGLLPHRNPKYNWKGVVPGNTSETLWNRSYFPLDSIPHIENPTSGYVFSTNASPYAGTGPEDHLNPKRYSPTLGYLTDFNNRHVRATELIEQYDKVSWEDFKRIKYDGSWNQDLYSYRMQNLGMLRELSPQKYPDLAQGIKIMQKWDGTTEINNREAALALVSFFYFQEKMQEECTVFECRKFTEEDYVAALTFAMKHLRKYFGRLDVELGEVQKHVRGDKVLAIGNGPDVLAANYSKRWTKGRFKSIAGDSYIQLVDFGPDKTTMGSVNAYGASSKPGSPHYDDQMELFVNKKLKPVTLDWEVIKQQAADVYKLSER